MLDTEPFAQIEKLDALFRRCDYIRYAGARIAVARGAVARGAVAPDEFTLAEKRSLADDAKSIIVFFERGGE